jgi:hypothetical protein
MSSSSSSLDNAKDALEITGLVMEVAQALGTILIALGGFAWSSQDKKKQEYNNRRQYIANANSQVEMEYAMSVFKDRVFEEHQLNDGDFQQIFSLKLKFPVAWQRKCRSRLMVLLETLRPIANLIGTHGGQFAIKCSTDPILFKFRLSMLALGEFWSPQGGLISPCTDDNREYIKSVYGSDEDWHLLCTAATRVGFEYGRFTGPWSKDTQSFETNPPIEKEYI